MFHVGKQKHIHLVILAILCLVPWSGFGPEKNMPGHGKGSKGKGKAKSHSSRAGLQFPVSRVFRLLRKGYYYSYYAKRIGALEPVVLMK